MRVQCDIIYDFGGSRGGWHSISGFLLNAPVDEYVEGLTSVPNTVADMAAFPLFSNVCLADAAGITVVPDPLSVDFLLDAPVDEDIEGLPSIPNNAADMAAFPLLAFAVVAILLGNAVMSGTTPPAKPAEAFIMMF